MNAQYETAKAIYSTLRNEALEAQFAHAEQTLEQLENRLRDFRNSVKYAKEENRSPEFDCNLRNLISVAASGLSQAPKIVDEFSFMTKIVNALKAQDAAK